MKLRVLLLALISMTCAKTEKVDRVVREPQGHIKYSDPEGLRVNWKFFNNYAQNSQAENSQRSQRGDTGVPRPQTQLIQPQHTPEYQPQYRSQHQSQHQPQRRPQIDLPQSAPKSQAIPQQPQVVYKPYATVPSHIKQLISQTYEPQQQRPYIDPSAFVYDTSVPSVPQHSDQQSALSSSEVVRSHYEPPTPRFQSVDATKYQTRRGYGGTTLPPSQEKVDYRAIYDRLVQQQLQQLQLQQQQPQPQPKQQEHSEVPRITVPIETLPTLPPPKLTFDKNMPSEIQQLLQYQANIPYDVMANKILYKPKTLFIPKPLGDGDKGTYQYRSKVYYVKNDNFEQYQPKPEEQDH